MFRFLVKRLLLSIPILIGITLIVFILSNLAPGGPLDILSASGNMTEAQLHNLEVSMGLDQPMVVRYAKWLMGLAHLDLGQSSKSSQAVSAMIAQRIGPSLVLSLTALALTLIIGITLGVLSAYKPYSFWDSFSSGVAFLGSSVPAFFISLVLIYILAILVPWLPAQGMYSNAGDHGFLDLLRHMALPVFVLVLQSCGAYIKQTRGSILEVMNEEYIKTARSKGLSEITVTLKHSLRNAWIPIVTQISLSIPYVIGGAVVTEQIFGWPGVGSLMMQAINTRDYNLIMGITVMISVVVLVANILLDLLYARLDPRIRVER